MNDKYGNSTHEDSNEHNVETFEIAQSDKHALKLM